MLRAVNEVRSSSRNFKRVTHYILRQEDGREEAVEVSKIKEALEQGLVAIENLVVRHGEVSPIKVNIKERNKYGIMDENNFWAIISKLSRTDIRQAEEELCKVIRYKLRLNDAVAFCNRAIELHNRLGNYDQRIVAFMSRVLHRCSDDQLTDFKYCLIWAGDKYYYTMINASGTDEAIKALQSHQVLKNDGECFGYACADVFM